MMGEAEVASIAGLSADITKYVNLGQHDLVRGRLVYNDELIPMRASLTS